MLWCYALEFYPDGCLPSRAELCRGAGWPVDDSERFISALLRAGEPTREGFIEIDVMLSTDTDVEAPIYLHDWGDYSGTFDVKKRRSVQSVQREEKRKEDIYKKKEDDDKGKNPNPATKKQENVAAAQAAFKSILANIAKKP